MESFVGDKKYEFGGLMDEEVERARDRRKPSLIY